MNKILSSVLLSIFILSTANAAVKFDNLSEDYLINKASVKVRETIAKNPQTSTRVLKFLTQDSNKIVRELATKNLKG